MSQTKITIATRESPLALWQAEHVKHLLQTHHPHLDVQLLSMTTEGDRFLSAPLSQAGGKGLFIKELEQSLLDGKADIAVHSMKDVTVDFPDGLQLSTILQREDPQDALISNQYSCLAELPDAAIVGTSSMRRRCQLQQLRPDLEIRDLRGNVGTRLKKLDAGEYDAILLAAAGIKRLGQAARISEYIPVDQIIPAIGQGAIGIESRVDDDSVNELLQGLDDPVTHSLIEAERIISQRLYGGCQLPIAAHARPLADQIEFSAVVGRLDGSEIIRVINTGSISEVEQLAETCATQLLAQGADRILSEVLNDG